MFDPRTINDSLTVAPQVAPDDMAAIKAQGFKAIICNRPDGEDMDQPTAKAMEAAAVAEGLEFHFLPIVSGQMTPDHVAQFGMLLDSLPKPTLAYCRTGTRCTMLWAMSQAGKQPGAELIAQAANAGYDLSGLAARLPA